MGSGWGRLLLALPVFLALLPIIFAGTLQGSADVTFYNNSNTRVFYVQGSTGNAEVLGTLNASALKVGTTNVCLADGTNCPASGGGNVTGTGTTNYLSKWTSTTGLGNSMLYDDGTNVGIGTTAPAYRLDVIDRMILIGSDNNNSVLRTNLLEKSIRFTVPHYNNSEEPATAFTATSTAEVNALHLGGGTSLANAMNYITFYTAANNTTLIGTERMRIDSTGNVGIGTTSPTAEVSNTKLRVAGGHVIVNNNYGFFSVNATSNGLGAGFDTLTDDGMDFYAGSGVKMSILSGGNVGIGTTGPTATLTINSSNSAGSLRVTNTTGSEHFFINGSTGYVGIGTTAPGAKLDVVGTINATTIQTSGTTRLSSTGVGTFATGTTINSQTAWHAGNDGAASTLDADLLDGSSSASFSGTGACGANTAVTTINGAAAPTCSTFWNSANDGAASTLDADLLDGSSSAAFSGTGACGANTAVTTINGAAAPTCSTFWNSANDGAASTLDADLLDGSSSASFSGTGACGANTAVTTINGAAAPTCSTFWNSANDGAASTLDADLLDGISSAAFSGTGACGANTAVTTINGAAAPTCSTFWNSANDGAASTLDADLLDGQTSTYFLDTSSGSQTKSGSLTISGDLTVSGNAYGVTPSMYKTSATHDGDHNCDDSPSTCCASGYHMCTMNEVLRSGRQVEHSGTDRHTTPGNGASTGWVHPSTSSTTSSCTAWSSISGAQTGTTCVLDAVGTWTCSTANSCANVLRIWCCSD